MRLQRPQFSSKPEPDRAQDPCTARIGATGHMTSVLTGFNSASDTANPNKHDACSPINKNKNKYKTMNVKMASKLPVSYRPALGRVGLWIELEMDWPPRPIHSYAPGTNTYVMGPVNNLQATDDTRWRAWTGGL
ncbi:hypothetical protein TIFTF001_039169 [Ficus carica]|uniref:Uncharacterized protein n=1 Tax=Ficus carica TaxID=3494 RepID=A0AA88E9B8_FICCA|nr:hypothetical protein TIFTF001_039169 [Ficus carica]